MALRLIQTMYLRPDAPESFGPRRGGKLALSLLEQRLVDEFRLHMAQRILGDNAALPLFDGRAPLRMDESLNMRIASFNTCGEDAHIILRPR